MYAALCSLKEEYGMLKIDTSVYTIYQIAGGEGGHIVCNTYITSTNKVLELAS